MGEDAFGINRSTIVRMTDEIAEVAATGVELAIVIGGGNIFRGVAPGAQGMDRATADYMGMMATIMNALALQDALAQGYRHPRTIGPEYRPGGRAVHPPQGLALPRRRQGRHLRRGHRQPFFTTDTAAARRRDRRGDRAEGHQGRRHLQRGSQQGPDRHALCPHQLRRGDRASPEVMDATAFALCRDQKLPIKVFSINKSGARSSAWSAGTTKAPWYTFKEKENHERRRNPQIRRSQDGQVA